MVANAKQLDMLLKSRKLASTAIRRQVLALLSDPGRAFSRKEIEQGLGSNTDRVTVYRTLKILVDHDILHKIIVDNQEIKYKLIQKETPEDHPHFHCKNCNRFLCLSSEVVNINQMPEGFQVHSAQLVMEGLCKKCNTR